MLPSDVSPVVKRAHLCVEEEEDKEIKTRYKLRREEKGLGASEGYGVQLFGFRGSDFGVRGAAPHSSSP